VYVPTLAERVLKDTTINLKGFLVGNAFSDIVTFLSARMYYAYYHGIIDHEQWLSLVESCCKDGVSEKDRCDFASGSSKSCSRLLYDISNKLKQVNQYNIEENCYIDADEGSRRKRSEADFSEAGMARLPVLASYPCLNNTAVTNYMNDPRIQAALHVRPGLQRWVVCSDTMNVQYNRSKSVRDAYLRMLSTKKLRMLLYNGDLDSLCNFLSEEWFVDSLNQTLVKPWRFWYTEGPYASQQIAGSVKNYENITFATVKGAGHSTPIDKPLQSFELFSRFLTNTF